MPRRLDAEEAALWARVMESVRPLRPAPAMQEGAVAPAAQTRPAKVSRPKAAVAKPAIPPSRPAATANTLDGGWDRRLARGAIAPDVSIDLHGYTLAGAHAALDMGLEQALARGERVVLLVTGRPPRAESERPHARGAIRAAVADWLAISRHAGQIAAVRGAHPRHGGAGALYLILKRRRGE